jgi:hypothetical protein
MTVNQEVTTTTIGVVRSVARGDDAEAAEATVHLRGSPGRTPSGFLAISFAPTGRRFFSACARHARCLRSAASSATPLRPNPDRPERFGSRKGPTARASAKGHRATRGAPRGMAGAGAVISAARPVASSQCILDRDRSSGAIGDQRSRCARSAASSPAYPIF